MREFYLFVTTDGKEFSDYQEAYNHTSLLVDKYLAERPDLQEFLGGLEGRARTDVENLVWEQVTGTKHGISDKEESQVPMYQSRDGEVFENRADCEEHEEELVKQVLESDVTMTDFFRTLRAKRPTLWDEQRTLCLDYAVIKAEDEQWQKDHEVILDPLAEGRVIASALRRELRRATSPL